MATKEFFPGIEKIKFEGKDSKNPDGIPLLRCREGD